MTRAGVRVAPDGEGLELVASDSSVEALEDRLRGLRPPVQIRRAGKRLLVPFGDAEALLNDRGGLEWSTEARHAVLNRRRVREVAPSILEEAALVKKRGPEAARARLGASELVSQLDDHQALNVGVMTLEGGWGACIFDEQGTGKTVTLIAAFDTLVERNEADVLLVVAPKSMVGEWATEFGRFTHGLYTVATLAGGSRRKRAAALATGADVIVANYEAAVSLRDDLQLLCRRSRVVLAVDESFNVKNPDARRTAAVAELREFCTRCFVLCGTPAPNAPGDLIQQFDLVDFGYTFAGVGMGAAEPSASDISEAMSARGLYTRNLKNEVLPDLPARRYSEVGLDLAPTQRELYEMAVGRLIADLRASSDVEFRRHLGSFLARRSALLQICSNPVGVATGYSETPAKLVALDDLLTRYVDAGEKVVVWSFYRASLDAIVLRYAPLGVVRVDGSVAEPEARQQAIRRFQEDDDVRVFVGNPAAAGAGLTLHTARIAVYESVSNQAAHFMQSLDRIHRRGQERDCEYLFLLCRGTLEEVEHRRLLAKADSQASVLGDPAPDRPTRELMLAELTSRAANERTR